MKADSVIQIGVGLPFCFVGELAVDSYDMYVWAQGQVTK